MNSLSHSKKYVICVPDGCADEPLAALGGRTPLEIANMPTLRTLAARGTLGRAATIPDGLPAGSDVGIMAILGYDPTQFHTGRAPIESAALGVIVKGDQVAFRCNLVTIDARGRMADYAGGHPSTIEASDVITRLNERLGDSVQFYIGRQYRHIMVAPLSYAGVECQPPHDAVGTRPIFPSGPGARRVSEVMEVSKAILSGSPMKATQIWLWGQGPRCHLPRFSERFRIQGGIVTAVDVVRGLGVLSGLDVIETPGATGWYDTDYAAKRDSALSALANGLDLVVVHVEASDEAGHAGDIREKIRALENWDKLILRGLIEGLKELGPWRLLFLPDHATPLAKRTHTRDPVPYLLVDSKKEAIGGIFSEAATRTSPVIRAHKLMSLLLRGTQA